MSDHRNSGASLVGSPSLPGAWPSTPTPTPARSDNSRNPAPETILPHDAEPIQVSPLDHVLDFQQQYASQFAREFVVSTSRHARTNRRVNLGSFDSSSPTHRSNLSQLSQDGGAYIDSVDSSNTAWTDVTTPEESIITVPRTNTPRKPSEKVFDSNLGPITRIYEPSDDCLGDIEQANSAKATPTNQNTESPSLPSMSRSTSYSYTADSGASSISASPMLFRSVTSLAAHKETTQSSQSLHIRNTSTAEMDAMPELSSYALSLSSISDLVAAPEDSPNSYFSPGGHTVSSGCEAAENVLIASPFLFDSPTFTRSISYSASVASSLNARLTAQNQDHLVQFPPPSPSSPSTPRGSLERANRFRDESDWANGYRVMPAMPARPTTAEDYASAIMSNAWRIESPATDFTDPAYLPRPPASQLLRTLPQTASAARRNTPANRITVLEKLRNFGVKAKRLFTRKQAQPKRVTSQTAHSGPQLDSSISVPYIHTDQSTRVSQYHDVPTHHLGQEDEADIQIRRPRPSLHPQTFHPPDARLSSYAFLSNGSEESPETIVTLQQQRRFSMPSPSARVMALPRSRHRRRPGSANAVSQFQPQADYSSTLFHSSIFEDPSSSRNTTPRRAPQQSPSARPRTHRTPSSPPGLPSTGVPRPMGRPFFDQLKDNASVESFRAGLREEGSWARAR